MRGRWIVVAAAVVSAPMLLAADRDPLAGRVPGKPVQCVGSFVTSQGAMIVDAKTILYRDGRRLWKTGPADTCPGLRPGATLILRIYTGQLCRNDTFQTLDAGTQIPNGPCRFSDFTPYTQPSP